jgi:hypothetical protein
LCCWTQDDAIALNTNQLHRTLSIDFFAPHCYGVELFDKATTGTTNTDHPFVACAYGVTTMELYFVTLTTAGKSEDQSQHEISNERTTTQAHEAIRSLHPPRPVFPAACCATLGLSLTAGINHYQTRKANPSSCRRSNETRKQLPICKGRSPG